MSNRTGMFCPATKARCDRPCVVNECQRVKLFGTAPLPLRPPDPDSRPLLLPAQIRAARAYLDMTMAELGTLAGISPQTICRLERDLAFQPQEATLRKLIGAFYDRGLEVFGTSEEPRGIRDFLPVAVRSK